MRQRVGNPRAALTASARHASTTNNVSTDRPGHATAQFVQQFDVQSTASGVSTRGRQMSKAASAELSCHPPGRYRLGLKKGIELATPGVPAEDPAAAACRYSQADALAEPGARYRASCEVGSLPAPCRPAGG